MATKTYVGRTGRMAGVIPTVSSAAAASQPVAIATPSGPVGIPNLGAYKGTLTQVLGQINGVTAGGNPSIQLAVGCRIMEIRLQCGGGSTYGVTAPTFTVAAGGTSTVVTGVLTGGKVTGLTTTTAGSGQTDGTYTVEDNSSPHLGAIIKMVISGGTLASATLIAQGGGGWVAPDFFFTGNLTLSVNNNNVWNIPALAILNIAAACGISYQNGILTMFFRDPSRKQLRNAAALALDLIGALNAAIIGTIDPRVPSPTLIGNYTFDYQPNTVVDANGNTAQNLLIINRQMPNFALPANQATLLNTLWKAGNPPIVRMWMLGATRNQITQLQLVVDSRTAFQGSPQLLASEYADYGFALQGMGGVSVGSDTIVPGGVIATPWDAALISDKDGQFWDCWRPQQQFDLYVTSATAMNLNIVVETLKNSYN